MQDATQTMTTVGSTERETCEHCEGRGTKDKPWNRGHTCTACWGAGTLPVPVPRCNAAGPYPSPCIGPKGHDGGCRFPIG